LRSFDCMIRLLACSWPAAEETRASAAAFKINILPPICDVCHCIETQELAGRSLSAEKGLPATDVGREAIGPRSQPRVRAFDKS
jgi:hypothetical protein